MKNAMILLLAVLFCAASLSACNEPTPGETLLQEAETAYKEALSLIEQGKYEEARDKLSECVGYKDTEEMLTRFVVKYAVEITERTNYYNFDGSASVIRQHQEYVYNRYGKPTLINYISYDGSMYSYDEVEYDEFGHIISQLRYGADGTLQKSFLRAFNEHGDITISEQIDHMNSFNSYRYHYVYEYYENGLIKSKTKYVNDWLMETEMWEYDEYGNETVYSVADSNGKLTSRERYTYEYDENGRIVNLSAKNSLGSLIYTYTYSYDANGNVTTENKYSNNGSASYKYVYEYDNNNNLLEKRTYDWSGNLNKKYIYEYNEFNDPTLEICFNSDGSENSICEYTYAEPVLYYDPFL